MTASPAELVGRLGSDDFNDRAKALAALVTRGPEAVPALTDAVAGSDARVRAQAAQALGEIADPASADTLAALTEDADADVRAHAAAGLARIGDARAPAALVATIDDLPDVTHHPYTLSVYGLIDLGDAALPALAPLLAAGDPTTRQRAFLVLQSVVSRHADWDALRDELGGYDAADREATAARWASWVRDRG